MANPGTQTRDDVFRQLHHEGKLSCRACQEGAGHCCRHIVILTKTEQRKTDSIDYCNSRNDTWSLCLVIMCFDFSLTLMGRNFVKQSAVPVLPVNHIRNAVSNSFIYQVIGVFSSEDLKDAGVFHRFSIQIFWTRAVAKHNYIARKQGYPQIIHFNGTFHYKPSIMGVPNLWKPPILPHSNDVLVSAIF